MNNTGICCNCWDKIRRFFRSCCSSDSQTDDDTCTKTTVKLGKVSKLQRSGRNMEFDTETGGFGHEGPYVASNNPPTPPPQIEEQQIPELIEYDQDPLYQGR